MHLFGVVGVSTVWQSLFARVVGVWLWELPVRIFSKEGFCSGFLLYSGKVMVGINTGWGTGRGNYNSLSAGSSSSEEIVWSWSIEKSFSGSTSGFSCEPLPMVTS